MKKKLVIVSVLSALILPLFLVVIIAELSLVVRLLTDKPGITNRN